MSIENVAFCTTAWDTVPASEHKGETGTAILTGELVTELRDGQRFVLTPGTSYQVAEDAEAHRSETKIGARLFIVN